MNKNNILIIVLLFLSVIVSACANQDAIAEYRTISPKEAKENMENNPDIILLDVRTKQEYDQEHIKGAILVPLDVLENEILNTIDDKNVQIYVYCRSGNRSKTASNILLGMGFTNIYDLGGIINWPYEKEWNYWIKVLFSVKYSK